MLTPNARNVGISRPVRFFDDSQKRIAVWHQPKMMALVNAK